MTKPHAEIREALVTGIRNNPEKSERLKQAAEVLIATIDMIGVHGQDEISERSFQQAYVNFTRAAGNEPSPELMQIDEIVRRLGLGKGEA